MNWISLGKKIGIKVKQIFKKQPVGPEETDWKNCPQCKKITYKPDLFENTNLISSNDISNTHALGQILYTDYIHVFQISGMILLVAMVGAIVLTFRQRSGVKKQSYIKQISRERAEGVEVLEVQSNKGVKIDD